MFGVRPANPGRDWDALGTGSQGKGTGPCGGAHEQCWGNGRLVGDGTRESGGENKVICGILQGFLYIWPVLTTGDSGLRWDLWEPPGLELLHSRHFTAPAPVPNTPTDPPSSPLTFPFIFPFLLQCKIKSYQSLSRVLCVIGEGWILSLMGEWTPKCRWLKHLCHLTWAAKQHLPALCGTAEMALGQSHGVAGLEPQAEPELLGLLSCSRS